MIGFRLIYPREAQNNLAFAGGTDAR
jgi:hypothetical protein